MAYYSGMTYSDYLRELEKEKEEEALRQDRIDRYYNETEQAADDMKKAFLDYYKDKEAYNVQTYIDNQERVQRHQQADAMEKSFLNAWEERERERTPIPERLQENVNQAEAERDNYKNSDEDVGFFEMFFGSPTYEEWKESKTKENQLDDKVQDAQNELNAYWQQKRTQGAENMSLEELDRNIEELEKEKEESPGRIAGAADYWSAALSGDYDEAQKVHEDNLQRYNRQNEIDNELAKYRQVRDMKKSQAELENVPNDVIGLLDSYNDAEYARTASSITDLRRNLSGESTPYEQNGAQQYADRKQEIANELISRGYDNYEQLAEYRAYIKNAQEAEKEREETQQFAQEHPIISSAATVAVSPVATVASAIGNAKSVNSETDLGYDANNPYNTLTNYKNETRDTVSNEMESGVLSRNTKAFLYQTAMSGADSIVASAIPGGEALLGAGAMNDAVIDTAQKGGTKEQALLSGIAAGTFETLFEHVSIGQLKAFKEVPADTVQAAVKNVAKAAASNFSEEAATEIANLTYDYLKNGGMSDYYQMIQQNIKQGMSEEEAKRAANIAVGSQIMQAGFGGALMGGVFGAAGSAMGRANYSGNLTQAGKSIADSGNVEQLIAGANDIDAENDGKFTKILNEVTSTFQRQQAAESVDAETGTGSEQAQVKAETYKNSDYKNIGKLAQMIEEKTDNEVKQIATQAVENRLAELGENEGNIENAAKAIVKVINDDKLSKTEQGSINDSKYAKRVINEYSYNRQAHSSAWAEALDQNIQALYSRRYSPDIETYRANTADNQTQLDTETVPQNSETEFNSADLDEAVEETDDGEIETILDRPFEAQNEKLLTIDEVLDNAGDKYSNGTKQIIKGLYKRAGYVTPEAFEKSFDLFYTYGKDGIDYEDVKDRQTAGDIDDWVKEHAYNSGVTARKLEEQAKKYTKLEGITEITDDDVIVKDSDGKEASLYSINDLPKDTVNLYKVAAWLDDVDAGNALINNFDGDKYNYSDWYSLEFSTIYSEGKANPDMPYNEMAKGKHADSVKYLGDKVAKIAFEYGQRAAERDNEKQASSSSVQQTQQQEAKSDIQSETEQENLDNAPDDYSEPVDMDAYYASEVEQYENPTQADKAYEKAKTDEESVNYSDSDAEYEAEAAEYYRKQEEKTAEYDINESKKRIGKYQNKTGEKGATDEVYEAVAAKLGVDIEKVRQLQAKVGNNTARANGKFDVNLYKITIAQDAENEFANFVHELGHFGFAAAKDKMMDIEDAIYYWYCDTYGEMDFDWLMADVKERYGNISDQEAFEEITSEALAQLFNEDDAELLFVEWLQNESGYTKSEQKTIIQRITDTIGKIIDTLREIIRKGKLSDWGSRFADMQLSTALDLRLKFIDVLNEIAENNTRLDMSDEEIRYSLQDSMGISDEMQYSDDEMEEWLKNEALAKRDFSTEWDSETYDHKNKPIRSKQLTRAMNKAHNGYANGEDMEAVKTKYEFAKEIEDLNKQIKDPQIKRKVDQKKVEEVAKRIKKDFWLKLSPNDFERFKDEIARVYESIAKYKNPKWKEIYEEINYLAAEFAGESHYLTDKELYQEARDTADYLKDLTIVCDSVYEKGSKDDYHSFKKIRNILWGKINISINYRDASQPDFFRNTNSMRGIGLDEFHEMVQNESILSPLRGTGYFDAGSIELSSVVEGILDFYENAKVRKYEEEWPFDEMETRQILEAEIYEGYFDAAVVEDATTAYVEKNKKAQEKLKAAVEKVKKERKQEYANALKKVKKEYSQKLKEKEKELKKKYGEKYSEKYAEKYKKQFLAQQAKMQMKMDQKNDTIARQDERKRIISKVKRLDGLLRKPTNVSNIPEGFQNAVLSLCEMFTDNTSVFDYKRLDQIRKAYAGLRANSVDEETSISGSYDFDIEQDLESLKDTISGKRLAQLTLDELRKVRNILDHFNTVIKNETEIFVNGKRMYFESYGRKALKELQAKGIQKSRFPDSKIKSTFAVDNLTPTYAFKDVGGVIEELYGDIRKGQDTYVRNLEPAKEKLEKVRKKYHFDKWGDETFKIKTSRGETLEFTREQAMLIFATAKREMLSGQESKHLLSGGIIYENQITSSEKGSKSPWAYKSNDKTAHPLALEDLLKISNKLTDEQKKYVDELVEYLSTDMAQLGNEVSMQLYGIKKFKERYYIPFNSADTFAYRKFGEGADSRLKSMSMTKATIKGAATPLVLSDFTSVWANHVERMSAYNALVVPLENFTRVWNYKTKTTDLESNASVSSAFESSMGSDYKKYVEQLMRDINGNVMSDSREGSINSLIRKFKKNAVFASMSVMIQQPSAICRAFTMVDPKYFTKTTLQKRDYDELMKYAPVAVLKEIGGFDTTSGKNMSDWILDKKPEDFKEKFKAFFDLKDSSYRDSVLAWGPEFADRMTWAHIWNAVKAETRAKTGLSGEKLLQKAGERFSEVIDRTQVYDSVLSRSGLMRSKSTGMQMVTAFMAEPTVSYNMLLDGVKQAKRGNKKYGATVLAAFVMTTLLNAALKSIITAARNDDDDKTYIEKYIAQVVSGFISDVNPLSLMPFVRDVISIFQGYDVNRADMDLFADVYNSTKTMVSSSASFSEKIQGFAGTLGGFLGVPAKNVLRDINSAINVANDITSGNKTTMSGIKYATQEEMFPILKGLGAIKSKRKAQRLFDAWTDGDAEMYNRVAKQYSSGESVRTALSGQIKEELLSGAIEEYDAINLLVKLDYKYQDAVKKVAKWQEPGDDSDEDEEDKYEKFTDYENVS